MNQYKRLSTRVPCYDALILYLQIKVYGYPRTDHEDLLQPFTKKLSATTARPVAY